MILQEQRSPLVGTEQQQKWSIIGPYCCAGQNLLSSNCLQLVAQVSDYCTSMTNIAQQQRVIGSL